MKVIVLDEVYVEGYGMGPFITPIELSEKVVKKLKKKSRLKIVVEKSSPGKIGSGYPIKLQSSSTIIKVIEETFPEEEVPVMEDVEEVVVPVVEVEEVPVVEEVEVEEEVPVMEEVEEVVVPVVEEVEVEEEVPVVEEVEEPVDSRDSIKNSLKEMTVYELKAKLDEMGIEYLYKDNKNKLISKIMENL